MIRILAFIIILIIYTSPLHSQVSGGNVIDSKSLLEMDLGSQLDNDKFMKSETMPVGNSINPDYYYIGPDDILSIQILPYLQNPKTMYVSPDCSILIPRLGVLNIKGLTLSQVRDTLDKLMSRNSPNAKVFVTLRDTRKCLVNIKGNVLAPTIYTLPSSYQVSTAISFANRFSTKESSISIIHMESVLKIREKKKDIEKLYASSGISLESEYWRRNIKLIRNDGTSQIIDIEKAMITANPKLDPYIREGDEIVVPFDKDLYSKISISGAVVRPVILAFKEGDKASDLLKFGYGTTEESDLDNIILYMSQSGKQINLKVDSSMKLISEDFEIEAGSRIIVGTKAEYITPQFGTVSIQGNVKKPGNYLIKLNSSKLKDLIQDAGGFSDGAYLPLAKVVRRQEINSTLIDPRKEIFETMQYSDLKSDDTTRFYIDIQYKKPIVAADFVELFTNNSTKDNVILQDGDIIIVPSNPGYVEVMGQVKNPGIVEFEEGRNMLWYIERAGGFAEGSEPFRARIVRGRTNVWIEGNEKTLVFAGDRIYVPRVPDEPTTVTLQKYIVYASILSTLTGLLNLIYLISRP